MESFYKKENKQLIFKLEEDIDEYGDELLINIDEDYINALAVF